MVLIEKTGASPGECARLAKRDTGKTINFAADDMSQRVTGEGIKREQNDVGKQDERAKTDAKAPVEPESLNRVVPENNQEDECNVEEIAVKVLQDQRKCSFAAILVRREIHQPRKRADQEKTRGSKPCGSSSRWRESPAAPTGSAALARAATN